MSKSEFERQFVVATRQGKRRLAEQPVAVGVGYDRKSRKIVVDLSNGCTLLVPPELAEGLSGAKVSDLAAVKILGPGTSIEWPKLDVQLSVSGLLGGVFGTAAWMGGQRAKTDASRYRRPRPAKTGK